MEQERQSETTPDSRPADTRPPVDLLWTGGWDSTFRLLDLLHRTPAVVRPWYVIDEGRGSTDAELRAMDDIRDVIAERNPAHGERLLTTRLRHRADIPAAPETTARYRRLGRRMRVGVQYDWLARLATDEGLAALELCVHDPSRALGAAIAENAERVETPRGPTFRLTEAPADPDLELFRPFSFPLLGWSKLDMRRAARERGFADLLERTWFCHEPRSGRPCGRCQPCQQVLQGGLGRRMPRLSRVLGRLRLTRRRIKYGLIDLYNEFG